MCYVSFRECIYSESIHISQSKYVMICMTMTVVTIDNEATESTSETTSNNSRWWFRIFFVFTPGELVQFDEHIFQMGWKPQPEHIMIIEPIKSIMLSRALWNDSRWSCKPQGMPWPRQLQLQRHGSKWWKVDGSFVISPKEMIFSMSLPWFAMIFLCVCHGFVYASRSQRLGWVPYMLLVSESFLFRWKKDSLHSGWKTCQHDLWRARKDDWQTIFLVERVIFWFHNYILAHRTSPGLESDSGTKFGSIFDWSLGLFLEGWSLRRIWKTDSM